LDTLVVVFSRAVEVLEADMEAEADIEAEAAEAEATNLAG
jgi:hypothetical protein